MKMLRDGQKRCGFRAFSRKPAAERSPRNIRPFAVAQPDNIDQCAFWRVNADRQRIADCKLASAQFERIACEDVNVDRLAQSRYATTTWQCYIQSRWDNVRQSMTCKRCDQTERASGGTVSNFQQLLIDLASISPTVKSASDLIDEPLISIRIKALGRDARGPGLGVREGSG